MIFGPDADDHRGRRTTFEVATDIARNMVTQWGLSDTLGPLAYGEEDGRGFPRAQP
ncbi:MAG: hypothetical protein KatS3mg121_1095 [Gammaproteobacteria bacterium]|nr:MAG: hypothetical protein KatS3mg121_1095 [Gammaproteobacteria bacterium]